MTIFYNRKILQQSTKQRGLSLVELMVGLVIGLMMSLVVYGVLNVNEGRKRTTTSLNDINQAGSYAIYQLEKFIRSSGSGFTGGAKGKVGASFTYGCMLDMALNGAQLAPMPTAFHPPFDSVSTVIRMAPVIIVDGAAGAGGDVIIAMAGSAGLGEQPIALSQLPTTTTLGLDNHAGVRANDIVLLAEQPPDPVQPTYLVPPCLMQQVASTFVPTVGVSSVPLAGSYDSATVNSRSAVDYSSLSRVINLGASPSLNMFAVGSNNTLMRYDLMQSQQTNAIGADPNPSVYVDGVYQMQALYGIDSAAAFSWVAPTGAFSAANLLAGTAAAAANLQRITAIKIGLVMRTALMERDEVSGTTLQLFNDTGLPVTVNLTPITFRYRSFEAVIPMRNTLMLQ